MEATLDKELFQQIQFNETEKKSLLRMKKAFVEGHQDNAPISIEQYSGEIDEAVARVEAGDFYSQEDDVDQMAKDW